MNSLPRKGGKQTSPNQDLANLEKTLQQEHGPLEWNITDQEIEEAKLASTGGGKDQQKLDMTALNNLALKMGQADIEGEPTDITLISQALKDFKPAAPSKNAKDAKDWNRINTLLSNFKQQAEQVGTDDIEISTSTTTKSTSTVVQMNTTAAVAPKQQPQFTSQKVFVGGDWTLMEEGKKMIAALKLLNDADLPAAKSSDLEKFHQKPSQTIDKLFVLLGNSSSSIDGKSIAPMVISELIFPIKEDLKLASDANREKSQATFKSCCKFTC